MGKNNMKKKPDEIRFYHGGFPGLVPGDCILPYTDTALSLRRNYDLFDPKKMFVTTSLELATAYALLFARVALGLLPNYKGPALGSVYEVKVKGPKEADEDFAELAPSRGGHFSYSVLLPPVVIKVVEDAVKASPPREYRLFAPFETWASPDGKVYPMWTHDGYMLPNAVDTAKGHTWHGIESQLKMGPFPGKDVLIQKGLYQN
ncbi:hypothetical protein ACVWY0_001090 [Arthrobacter sp. UYNi723]